MRYLLCLVIAVALAGALGAAAPPVKVSAKGKPAEVFGPTRVWTMHLTVQPKEFEKMVPARGGFFIPARPSTDKKPPLSDDRKIRGGFGFDFEYVKADLSIDGAVLKDVALRFKGNSTYQTVQGLKKPFRIDFDRFVEGQNFKGVRKLSLNNHVMDSSAARENLAFALYREAGVPAPRTAYVETYLTVPGKYQREFLGLYTAVEAVDKPFLKAHFGNNDGLLVKPERVGALEYVGEDWKEYDSKYRPKSEVDEKTQRKLIDLCWLVQRGDDKAFRAEIAKRLDVDRFLRYLACTVLLSSMDSFVGLGHNYYLYLDQKKDRFVVIPWDVDHSFGGFGGAGKNSPVDLSVERPQMGNNRLVERLLAEEKYASAYRGHLKRLIQSASAPERIKRDFDAITKVTGPIRAREKKAAEARKEGNRPNWLVSTPSADLPDFVSKRVASVESQLDGKTKGNEMKWGLGGLGGGEPLWLALPRPLLAAADKDKDGSLSKAEAVAGVKALFTALDKEKQGSLDEKTLSPALLELLPAPHNRKGPFNPAASTAKIFIEKAGKDGKLGADSLVDHVEKSFASADRNKDGKLDERELTEALRQLIPPPPPFGFPAPKKEEKK